MNIYGAGLSGLIAACHFPQATIFDSGSPDQIQHQALLRFRTAAVGLAVGIEFRPVRVYKGLWSTFGGGFVKPNIQLANQYSNKVIGRLADRSVWNLDTVERFIAPEDIVLQLAEKCDRRIVWNTRIEADDFLFNDEQAISTLPLDLVAGFLGVDTSMFKRSPVHVTRYRIPGADVFQTVYYPDQHLRLYRASITGDLLIAESMAPLEDNDTGVMLRSFGLDERNVELLSANHQRYGKIAPVDDVMRKNLIHRLTADHNVFSLGRFGTWRNILLDDVLQDISILKKLMKFNTYDRHRAAAK